MANKRITDVDYIDSLNSNESFFVNHNNTIKQVSKSNIVVGIANGGTGATNASDARDNLGLGAVAVEDVLPVSKGGTGGTTLDVIQENLNILSKDGGKMSGEIDMGSNKIVNLATPTENTDAANKEYVDYAIQNRLQRTVLFSNSNISNEYGTNNISVSNLLSSYDDIAVVSVVYSEYGNTIYKTDTLCCIKGTQVVETTITKGSAYSFHRLYTLSDNSINISLGYYSDSEGKKEVNNMILIPYTIYGIKY